MIEPTLQEQLVSHPKAIISTDDNYPTIIQIPLDDLTTLIEKAERKARIQELEKVKLVEETYWQSDEEEPQDTTNYIDERIKTLKGEAL